MKPKASKKTIIITALAALMILSSAASAFAVSYLPGVTEEMTKASYWAGGKNADKLLLSADEIKAANELYIASKGTNLNDLKALPETLDGYAQRDALAKSAKADTDYYLGWTYDKDGNLLTESYFNKLIENTQDRSPAKPQKMRYGITVNRTLQRTFPSFDLILDDPADLDFNYMGVSSLRVGEPVAILAQSADKQFYLAKSISYTGWVDVNDIALCADRDEWLAAWDFDTTNAIVVYGDKVFTETSNYDESISKKMLSIGTVLESAEKEDALLYGNRSAYYGYPVYIPARNEDGTYRKAEAVIPMHQKVSVGYLPLTEKNFTEVFLGNLGDAYGWGGILDSNDCSGTVRDIYKCFGLELPRNTTWQKNILAQRYDMSTMCSEEKIMLLDTLPLGTTLFFSGHEMSYLGKVNGKYYVISNVSNIMNPDGSGNKQRVRAVIINNLDVKRANGNTWLASLNYASIPYRPYLEGKDYKWFYSPSYHDAVYWAMSNKIMIGGTDGYFMPDERITAEQIDIIKARIIKYFGEEVTQDPEKLDEIEKLAAGLKGKKRSAAAAILMEAAAKEAAKKEAVKTE